MIKSTATAKFKSDIQTIWEVITDNTSFEWRSDLEKIEMVPKEDRFLEYAKNGIVTEFSITEKEPFSLYRFSFKNKAITGNWTGRFLELSDGGTEVILTEEIVPRGFFMKIIARLFMPIKKMQMSYLHDLAKRLGE